MSILIRNVLTSALFAFILIMLCAAFNYQWPFLAESPLIDSNLYSQAAERFRRGELIYINSEPLAETYRPGAMVYKMTPFYLLPFIGLSYFDYLSQRQLVLGCFYLAAAILLLALMLRWFVDKTQSISTQLIRCLITAVAIVWFQPAQWSFHWVSAELWLVCLSLLALLLMPNRPLFAGILIALATALKLYPILFLLLPICSGRVRVLQGFLLGIVLFAVITLLIVPFESIVFYVRQLLPILSREPIQETLLLLDNYQFGNWNWFYQLQRFVVSGAEVWHFQLARLTAIGSSAWLLWRSRRYLTNQSAMLTVLLVLQPLLLICLPNVFFGYFCWLLLPLIYWLFIKPAHWIFRGVLVFMASLLFVPQTWLAPVVGEMIAQLGGESVLQGYTDQAGFMVGSWLADSRLGLVVVSWFSLAFLPWLCWLLGCWQLFKLPAQQRK